MTFLDPPQYATSMVVLGNAPKLIGEKPMKSNPQEQGSANKDRAASAPLQPRHRPRAFPPKVGTPRKTAMAKEPEMTFCLIFQQRPRGNNVLEVA